MSILASPLATPDCRHCENNPRQKCGRRRCSPRMWLGSRSRATSPPVSICKVCPPVWSMPARRRTGGMPLCVCVCVCVCVSVSVSVSVSARRRTGGMPVCVCVCVCVRVRVFLCVLVCKCRSSRTLNIQPPVSHTPCYATAIQGHQTTRLHVKSTRGRCPQATILSQWCFLGYRS
jgi:hypothetical protein